VEFVEVVLAVVEYYALVDKEDVLEQWLLEDMAEWWLVAGEVLLENSHGKPTPVFLKDVVYTRVLA
jgi:hypothetical protein